ncbi:hypothetical protein LOY98_001084 [Ophidiomyces ophidiicola]|nr:hypothetical protein LOY98_001084 [Ophidiomyces ophidiicola]
MSLRTPLCDLLAVRHPVLLAGMARTSGAPLAAAVSNAGGLGTVGGLGYTPAQLDAMLTELRAHLATPDLPFGVDLALPQLVEVAIRHRARLFVSAVGVPPARTIARLHAAGILVMNMVGAPRHAHKALRAGVDLLCAQGGEGGGHTGDVPFSVLVPAVVDVARAYTSPLTGRTPLVVAAGGVNDGRSLAAALMLGAAGVWVGTRFVASHESGASRMHKDALVAAGFHDTIRTLVVSGRPLRVLPNEYVADWEKRPDEIRRLTESGVVPLMKDLEDGKDVDLPFLMGSVAGAVNEIKPAREIVESMVAEAATMLRLGSTYLADGSKL